MTEYTPEKVAEARKRLEAELPRWERYTGDKFPGDIRAILTALTAASAERDEAREAAEGHVLDSEATYGRLMPKLKKAVADRDRLHKALESVEDFVTAHYLDTSMGEKVLGVLRAALDKEGNGDE